MFLGIPGTVCLAHSEAAPMSGRLQGWHLSVSFPESLPTARCGRWPMPAFPPCSRRRHSRIKWYAFDRGPHSSECCRQKASTVNR